MKKLALLLLGFSFTFAATAQEDTTKTVHSEEQDLTGKKIASMKLMDIDGNEVNTSELGFDGPVIFSFWATWCSPCKAELNTIQDLYPDWQEETNVTLVAVSIDDQRTASSVPMYANGKGWEYLVLLDPNSDFKRAMGVNNVPHTFLVNTDGTIVYSHNSYSAGDEDILYQELLKLSAEK